MPFLRRSLGPSNGTPRQPLLVPSPPSFLDLPAGGVPPSALEGLEGYSHCWLLFLFHCNTDIDRLWRERGEGRKSVHADFRAKVVLGQGMC